MKKILIVGVIGALFLSACSILPTQTNEEVENTVRTNADTILDKELFEIATSTRNISKCDQILNKEEIGECKTIVESLKLMSDAYNGEDKSFCNDIKINRYKEICEVQVQEKINAKKIEQEKEEEVLKSSQQAMDTNDESLCNEIEDSNRRYSCKYNILANKAIQKKDESICEQIGDVLYTERCKDLIVTSQD